MTPSRSTPICGGSTVPRSRPASASAGASTHLHDGDAHQQLLQLRQQPLHLLAGGGIHAQLRSSLPVQLLDGPAPADAQGAHIGKSLLSLLACKPLESHPLLEHQLLLVCYSVESTCRLCACAASASLPEGRQGSNVAGGGAQRLVAGLQQQVGGLQRRQRAP